MSDNLLGYYYSIYSHLTCIQQTLELSRTISWGHGKEFLLTSTLNHLQCSRQQIITLLIWYKITEFRNKLLTRFRCIFMLSTYLCQQQKSHLLNKLALWLSCFNIQQQILSKYLILKCVSPYSENIFDRNAIKTKINNYFNSDWFKQAIPRQNLTINMIRKTRPWRWVASPFTERGLKCLFGLHMHNIEGANYHGASLFIALDALDWQILDALDWQSIGCGLQSSGCRTKVHGILLITG